jgi:hypothetical protein
MISIVQSHADDLPCHVCGAPPPKQTSANIKNTNTKSTKNQYVEAWSTTTDANNSYTRHYELKR